MNFTSFGISNFKAFGNSHQRMPIKPITLIFGSNSSGKSSLIHSLLWTAEVIEQRSFDIRSSKRVSGNLDLGGFLSVLRGHDTKNKIKASVEIGNTLSGESVQIALEFGIRTNDDSFEIYKREWLDVHSDTEEIKEFFEKRERVANAVEIFNNAFSYQYPETQEVEAALATDEAWNEQIERHNLNSIRLEIEPSSLPAAVEARAIYQEAQLAWERQQELAPKIIPLIKNLYSEFKSIDQLEKRVASVLSCKVQIGGRSIMQADRCLGLSSLSVDPTSFVASEWEALLSINNDHNYSEDETTSSMLINKIRQTGFVSFRISESIGNPKLDAAIAWLSDQLEQFGDLMDSFVMVGPLRALPSRRELLGFPSETTTDPLLRPWLRLRDDEVVLKSVNDTLNRLTGSHLSFWRASFGRIGRLLDIEEVMPENPLKMRTLGGRGPSPTNWKVAKFFDGYVAHSSDFISPKEGPFYQEAKEDYELDLAAQLVEQHLSREFPNEILFDLLLRDGRSGVDIKPQDVGVGISQIAPVLVQAFGNRESMIAIEQPEIHIHPALQAELGDVFIETALGPNQNKFLLETHSEHLILRILRRIRETTEGDMNDWPEALRKACPNGILPEDVAVLYVQPGEDGSEVIEMPIDANGEFTCEWPGGFFEERLKEFF